MIPASIVLFAIQSAVKLAGQSREAYVDSTRRRELVLPLPNFNPSPGIGAALSYFKELEPDVSEPQKLRALLDKIVASSPLTPEEQEELVLFHSESLLAGRKKPISAIGNDGSLFNDAGLEALVTIRQWHRGSEPKPSVLQRMAGSLVEIGVDYFANVPEALNQDSKHGKALYALFSGLDHVQFATAPLETLPSKLLISTLEVVSEQSELLTSDPKMQELISVTTSSLMTTVNKKLEEIRKTGSDSLLEGRVHEWAELVFRSVIASGGRLVVENPKKYLGIQGDGTDALVTHVGEAVLDLALQDEMDRIFSREGIDTVVKAALIAVGKHPSILVDTKNQGIKVLISQIANQLGQYDTVLTPNILPEITRLILEKTGENLLLLWPDLTKDPAKNLLLTCAATALEILTKAPDAGAPWQPKFNRDDLIFVVDTVLNEFVGNPGWLVNAAGELKQNLQVALESVIHVLRNRGDTRLSTKTATEILRASLLAIAMRSEFLEDLPDGRKKVTAILDVTLGMIFEPNLDPKVAWVLVRNVTINGIIRVTLEQLSDFGVTEAIIKKLAQIFSEQFAAILKGNTWNLEVFERNLIEAIKQP